MIHLANLNIYKRTDNDNKIYSIEVSPNKNLKLKSNDDTEYFLQDHIRYHVENTPEGDQFHKGPQNFQPSSTQYPPLPPGWDNIDQDWIDHRYEEGHYTPQERRVMRNFMELITRDSRLHHQSPKKLMNRIYDSLYRPNYWGGHLPIREMLRRSALAMPDTSRKFWSLMDRHLIGHPLRVSISEFAYGSIPTAASYWFAFIMFGIARSLIIQRARVMGLFQACYGVMGRRIIGLVFSNPNSIFQLATQRFLWVILALLDLLLLEINGYPPYILHSIVLSTLLLVVISRVDGLLALLEIEWDYIIQVRNFCQTALAFITLLTVAMNAYAMILHLPLFY